MTADPADQQRMACPHCGQNVPPGTFCGVCGGYLPGPEPHAAHRPAAFAAYPSEHLLHPSPITTLFPHLPHYRSAPFRLGLLGTAILLLILGYERLTGPAIAAAALCVPLLYLLYLTEVQVYEDEPLLVIGATVVLGALLGTGWALLTSRYVTGTLVLNLAQHPPSVGRIIVVAILIPLGALALMLVGPIVLFFMRRFDEALDGFTFGAASALGFSLATTVVELSPQVTAGALSYAPATGEALTILERGLLLPFIYATITGLITGALWLRRGRRRQLRVHGWTTTLWATVGLAMIVQIVLGFATIYVPRHAVQVLIYGGFALFLLFAARVAIHHMLLAEAVETPIGPLQPCVHCRHLVPRMAFCPVCGVATRATPKTGAGSVGRGVR